MDRQSSSPPTGWPDESAPASWFGLPFEAWRLMGGMANCGWISIDRHRSGAYWRIEAYNAVATADELGPE